MFNWFCKWKLPIRFVYRLFFALLGRSIFATIFFLSLAFTFVNSATLLKANELDERGYTACVVCNDPGKVYQCSYRPNELFTENSSSPPTINIKGLQFACIQEIAQYGGHGQCAYVRKSSKDCNGEIYTLRNSSSIEQVRAPQTLDEDQSSTDGAIKPKEKSQPTLVDETKKTYKKTTKSVQKTLDKTSNTVKKTYDKTSDVVKDSVKSVGQGIGDAASTTYKCITSFFQKC